MSALVDVNGNALRRRKSKAGDKLVKAVVSSDITARKGDDAIRKAMSPKGKLGLCPLLEARRWVELIPDNAFKTHAVFDRILVMQVDMDKHKETFGDTGILMPDTARARINEQTCRGIIISAGLLALDELRSNGIDLGHYVRFIKNAPWKMQVDTVEGHEVYELVMRSGDLVSDEDLSEALRRGECRIEYDAASGKHGFVDKKGVQWQPKLPWIAEDQ